MIDVGGPTGSGPEQAATVPSSHASAGHADCGCGCGGSGGCEDAKTPANRARRSFLVGGGTTVLVSTLINHRAFAQGTCGPVSHAGSLTPSATTTSQCGGLTPGYWAQHQNISGAVLGFTESPSSKTYSADLKTFLTTTTLGSRLPNLALIDQGSATATFCQAFGTPRNDGAFHWACAILCALSPNYNPQYGYTITSLNQAILAAHNNNVSGSMILTAIESLENDYNTNAPGGAAMTVC